MLRKVALAVLFAGSLRAQVVTPSTLKFDVASIKPTTELGNCWSPDPGRFSCKGTLSTMIYSAFALRAYQWPPPDQNVATKDQKYEVIASVPAETAKKWGARPNESFQDMKAMLRNLLIERFKLTYHYEKREVQGYTLTTAKSGFKPKADPASQPIGAPKDYVPPAGSVSQRGFVTGESWLDVRKASMKVFAEGLSSADFNGVPMVDETGLNGVYSFNLHFDKNDTPQTAPAAATDPLPTIFEALGQQGLKLTPRKVMGDFFVIDHAEKSPIGN
jgi:uncharacterized protein (TIGR03435 family)